MSTKLLFAKEYGWEATEVSTVLAKIPTLEVVEILREKKSFDSLRPEQFDLILTYGPHIGSMMPLLKWLKQSEPTKLPRLIWWLNENIPEIEVWKQTKFIGQLRMFFDQYIEDQTLGKSNWFDKLGHRYRILAELFWLQQQNIPLLVATTSKRRSELLSQLKFNSIHVPMGWGPSNELGFDLNLERNIPVVWVGSFPKIRSRRVKIIKPLLKELEKRNIQVELYTKNLTGQHRTEVLNRAKILLNLLRHPLDYTGHRLILGAANKALLVSEIMVDPMPFESEKHMIQVPVEQLAEKIAYYLKHEEERKKIVDAAYDLVMNELTMENAVKQVLREAGVNHFGSKVKS